MRFTGENYSINVVQNMTFQGNTFFRETQSANITVHGCVELGGKLIIENTTMSAVSGSLPLLHASCIVRRSPSPSCYVSNAYSRLGTHVSYVAGRELLIDSGRR